MSVKPGQAHNTTGLAPLSYLAGIELGAQVIHTASRPLANGPSVPSVEAMTRNIVALGHTHSLDEAVLTRIADHFETVAERDGLPTGSVPEYDVTTYSHQIPGGMQGTLRNQLAEHGMGSRLPELLEEAGLVRAELGWPGMATPFSQLVGTQALLNITIGERYKVVPDEVIIYVLGHLGQPPGTLDPDVVDRILASPRAQEFQRWTPPQPSIGELRRRFPADISDDELILRLVLHREDVDAMLAAGPVRRHIDDTVAIVKRLLGTTVGTYLSLETGSMTLALARR